VSYAETYYEHLAPAVASASTWYSSKRTECAFWRCGRRRAFELADVKEAVEQKQKKNN
jgi:hypothetical protein